MGLNISGIVINKNYENDLAKLEEILGKQLIFEKEIVFEDTYESFKDDHYCDVYYSKNGTYISVSMEIGAFDFYADNQDVLSFVLSEMTMVFSINYVKGGKLVRTIVESEDEIQEDEGTPLKLESTEEHKDELIYALIEETLGESFHEIDLGAKCKRYTFKSSTAEKIVIDDASASIQTPKTTAAKKPWWKIW
ncbi:hypothetical protein [Kordia sp.]|uniref:hypothetical protein n=1 Tax=Kordia sp. TaxID=1965332 RepID=UPI003B5C9E00